MFGAGWTPRPPHPWTTHPPARPAHTGQLIVLYQFEFKPFMDSFINDLKGHSTDFSSYKPRKAFDEQNPKFIPP